MARLLTLTEIEEALSNGIAIDDSRSTCYRMPSMLIRGVANNKAIRLRIVRNSDGNLMIALAYLEQRIQWSELSSKDKIGGYGVRDAFGECFFCGGQIKSVFVGNFDYRLEGKLYVIKNTPAGLCLQCGEKYLTAQAAEKINALIKKGQFAATEQVRVMAYDQNHPEL